MSYKAYESLINLELMWQMKDMITRISGVKSFGFNQRKPFFKRKAVQESMESQFGFRYPGEVLERYQERCGDTAQNLRALAVAVADEKEFLEDCMFIGNQKTAFIRRIRENAKDDIYLQVALYVLTEGKTEKERLAAELKKYKPKDSLEYCFFRSALSDLLPVCEADMHDFVNFLGEGRTMEAYGNGKIFLWAVEYAESVLKRGCKKIPGVVKSLMRLPFHQVKEGSVYWEDLRKAGYSCQEILYLNMKLPFLAESDDALEKDSIVTERIVAYACQEILNADHVESPVLYQEIASFLFLYEQFAIRLEGYKGLHELLRDRVQIRDVALFLDFYKRKGDRTICEEWLRVDLSDKRWDKLASSMPREEYTELFEMCFLYCEADNGKKWMETYERLCGESYLHRIWTEGEYHYYTDKVFRKLAKEGVIDLSSHIICYAEDLKKLEKKAVEEKWNGMLQYISKAVKEMDCYEVFRFWDTYDQLFGMEALRTFTERESLVSSAVGFRCDCYNQRYYSKGDRFWVELDFLSEDEQRKMFSWACDEIYMHSPENYNVFLLNFLEKKGMDLLSKEQCRDLADMLIKTVDPNSYVVGLIRNKFYEKEELEIFAEQERIRKVEEEKRRVEEYKKRWREDLLKGMDASTGGYSLGLLAENYNSYISAAGYHEVAYSCIHDEMEKGNHKIEHNRIGDLLHAMGTIVEHGAAGWEDVCRLINRLEVVKDEPGKNKEKN